MSTHRTGAGMVGASSLACLFAERFLPAGESPRASAAAAAPSFGTGGTVDLDLLGVTLLVVAVWSLQQDRQLEALPDERRRLGVLPVHTVRISPVPGGTTSFAGLEGLLLGALASYPDGVPLPDLVRAVVPTTRVPALWVARAASREVADAGYLQPVSDDDCEFGYAPADQPLSLLEPSADALARAWQEFVPDPLHDRMVDCVHHGLESRRGRPPI